MTWSCNGRTHLDYDTIKSFKNNGLRLFLVGYESGNDDILTRIKKGVATDEMRGEIGTTYPPVLPFSQPAVLTSNWATSALSAVAFPQEFGSNIPGHDKAC